MYEADKSILGAGAIGIPSLTLLNSTFNISAVIFLLILFAVILNLVSRYRNRQK